MRSNAEAAPGEQAELVRKSWRIRISDDFRLERRTRIVKPGREIAGGNCPECEVAFSFKLCLVCCWGRIHPLRKRSLSNAIAATRLPQAERPFVSDLFWRRILSTKHRLSCEH